MPKLDIAGNNSLYGVDSDEIETGKEVKFHIAPLMGGIQTPKSNDVEFNFSMNDPVGTYHFIMPDHDVKIVIESVSVSNPFGYSHMTTYGSLNENETSNSNNETQNNLSGETKNE